MPDKNLHNTVNTHRRYATPGIPADLAWLHMKALLDEKDSKTLIKDNYSRRRMVGILLFATLLLILFTLSKLGGPLNQGKNSTAVKTTTTRPLVKEKNKTGMRPIITSANKITGTALRDTVLAPVVTKFIPAGQLPLAGKNGTTKNTVPVLMHKKSTGQTTAIKITQDNTRQQATTASPSTPLEFFGNWPVSGNTEDSYTSRKKEVGRFQLLRIYSGSKPLPGEISGRDTSAKIITGQVQVAAMNRERTPVNSKNLKHATGFGLQWQFNLPAGSKEIANADAAKRDRYDLLLPALWISKDFRRHTIRVSVDPVQKNAAGNARVSSSTGTLSPADTNTIIKEVYLNRIYGSSLSASWQYRLAGSWYIGLGWQYASQRRMLVNQRVTYQTSGTVYSDSAYVASLKSGNPGLIRSSVISVLPEISFRRRKMNAGISMQLPLTPLSSGLQDKRPVITTVFLRWQLN